MPKTLILMRHGEYDEKTGSLTPRGLEQVRDVARQLLGIIPAPDSILYSPTTRTEETYRAVAEVFKEAGLIIPQDRRQVSEDLQTADPIHDKKAGDILRAAILLSARPVKPQNPFMISHASEIAAAVEELFSLRDEYRVVSAQAIFIKARSDADSWVDFVSRDVRKSRYEFRPNDALLRPPGIF